VHAGAERNSVLSKKRLLVLTSRFPYPPLSGGKLMLMSFARALGEYELTLLSLCGSREEMETEPEDETFAEVHKVYLPKSKSYLNVLRALLGRSPLQLAYYQSDAFLRKVEELLPRHDAVIAHLVRTGQYIDRASYRKPSVLLMSDAISLAYHRMTQLSGAHPLWHFLYRAEYKRLLSYERSAPEKFSQTWLHSEVDRSFLGLTSKSVRILPVGVDLQEFPFNPAASGDVVAFIGNMSFSLNIDACKYFVKEIFPDLRRRAGLRFRVIGACPESVRHELEKIPAVEVTGRVRRIADALGGTFCGVCPVRGGSGIQTKILNYLALGLPCVTSRVGLEGLNAVDGRDLLVYEDPRSAAEMILRLHGEPRLREEIASNGRKLVETTYDYPVISRSVRECVAELLADESSHNRKSGCEQH
jgi:glycosyltransferase involved in cell wall biosynthesis